MFGLSQINSINEKSAKAKAKRKKPADESKAIASKPVKFKTIEGVCPGSQFSVGNE